MAFDVSKFLALTALIASTGAACSGADKEESGKGGTSGSGTSGDAGKATQGGADNGVGGAAAGNGGDAGDVGGAAGAGGAALGGAAGAGGAGEVGECLGSLAEGGAGGAGGAPAVEPSLEGLCMDYFDVVCAASPEDYAPSYKVCEGVKERGSPAVAVAVEACISALSAADACDGAKVSACFTDLAGQGCKNPASAAACTTIKGRDGCDAVELVGCKKIVDLVGPDSFDAFSECMDPSIEGFYDPDFAGTCEERLQNCAGVFL
jgi:hypothetical protein